MVLSGSASNRLNTDFWRNDEPRGTWHVGPLEARSGGWERWGIMGHALEQSEHTATCDELRARVTLMIADAREPSLRIAS